jgi:purine-nucleoside phosphorylase
MTSEFISNVYQAAADISNKTGYKPKVGMILGSGLSSLSESYDCTRIPYSDIPVLPKPTVEGHKGELYINKDIAICSGRFHYYEGHSPENVVSTVALLRGLGCEKLIVTNAAGGINREFKPGDIMIITDHINTLGFNPLMGANPEVGGKPLGPRFPDMSRVYHPDFAAAARKFDDGLVEGVYLATTGPSYETPAEIRAFAAMGADAVGMSTVPEAIFARYLGMDVGGFSLITNFAAGLGHESLDHAEVVEIGRQAADRMKALVARLVQWWLA